MCLREIWAIVGRIVGGGTNTTWTESRRVETSDGWRTDDARRIGDVISGAKRETSIFIEVNTATHCWDNTSRQGLRDWCGRSWILLRRVFVNFTLGSHETFPSDLIDGSNHSVCLNLWRMRNAKAVCGRIIVIGIAAHLHMLYSARYLIYWPTIFIWMGLLGVASVYVTGLL